MIRKCSALLFVALAAGAFLASPALPGDWPTYKGDAARSSVSTEAITFPLAKTWVYKTSLPPQPAWPEPGKELHRVDFDYAFQPVISDGLIYFGSSADDTVRALNADTGELVWRFITGGPVRFAPAVARGKAYVASDDGYLYCLDAKTGKEVWRFHAASSKDHVLGNSRMISRFPCRTGALVVDDVVYVTAGMWPTEGVYVYALDAETGKERWCNDRSGCIYIDLPHAVASGFSGVAPQGYLAASKDVLLVPTGRSVPAAFDRHTGRLLYYKPEKTHYHGASYGGGVWCTVAGDLYFHTKNRFHNPSEAHVGEADPCPQDGMICYSFLTGDQAFSIGGKYRVVASGDTIYAVGNGSIDAIDLNVALKKKRLGPKDIKWTTPHPSRVYCMAMAGNTILTGDRDGIRAFNAADGKPVWQTDLKGRQVRGMAVANGRIVAATRTGAVMCFGPGDAAAKPIEEKPKPVAIPDEHKRRAKDSNLFGRWTKGYAVVIGEPDSLLAQVLGAQTELHIVNVVCGAERAAAERQRLQEVGLLGARVAVHEVEDMGKLHLPSYFADLVIVGGKPKGDAAKECYRVLRPCGGALCFLGADDAARKGFIRDAAIPASEVAEGKGGVVRGRLPGSNEWRYPWADGGRTGIGRESRVRFPVEVLWFGGPGPGRLVDRHLMGSPPVSANGRVFMQGVNDVVAFDAYNGRELWSRHIEGVGRKYAQYYSSSIVAGEDSVYTVQSDKCLCLDQATGKAVLTYRIPDSVIKETGPPAVPDFLHIEWPSTWQVIGPFPKGKPPLSGGVLKSVPKQVKVKGKEYAATEVTAVGGMIDFTSVFDGFGLEPLAPGAKPTAQPRRGKKYSFDDVNRICYAFAKIQCPKAGKLLIGAGADWGMQWFLDGEPVFAALRLDSSSRRRGFFERRICSPKDRVFDVDVTAGEHVLAVMVVAGSRGWALSSASLAGQVKEAMPIATGANPNVPNLKDLIWGYLSVTDDFVLGSYNVPVAEGQDAESHLLCRSESKAVFALDKKDGSLRWVYRPKPGRIVSNIEIAFGDGRLFLIDGTSKADLVRAKRRRRKIDAKLELVALNLADGSELWRRDDVPMLGDRTNYSRLKTNITHLFMGQPNWGHLVYADGVVLYGVNAAFDAATGKKLWQRKIRPGKLPLVYGDWIITLPYAYGLRTGEQRMVKDAMTGETVPWRYARAYGCGPIAGCQNMLFFRSGADGFFDMRVEGTTNFGGVRPGCARTLLAANGLLLHPQGYSGCCCSYNFKANLALASSSDRGDTWYVFPARATTGPIRDMSVNFGAPGDRKDDGGKAWLGFPRPMLGAACPAPLTVLMRHADCYRRRRAAAAIRKTDVPWVYSSGLRGEGRIAVGLDLHPGLVLPQRDAAPAVDGKVDDACWQAVKPVPFMNSAFSMVGASLDLRVFRDGENIYFGYRRSPLAHPRTDVDPAALGTYDRLEIFLADPRKRAGIRLVVQRDGTGRATFGTVGTSRKVDRRWKGEWTHAVQQAKDGWTAEVAVPIKTLTDCGIDLKRLQLNCMSLNLTQSGWEGVFLTDPYYGVKFRCCSRFMRVVPAPAKPPTERSFTVRLHFAEIDGAKPGERVFGVAVQSKPVLTDLDIAAEAGENTALVKEFTGVKATDRIVIDLTPKPGSKAVPVLCAMEVVAER